MERPDGVKTRPSVLFVCLGNICRSPMAEGAFRAAAERAGLEIACDSAGTGNWHVGEPPDTRAQAEMLKHGIDISRLRGRQIEEADYLQFTHIFALDSRNLADIRAMAPRESGAAISLLMDIVSGMSGQSVADPYFGKSDGFSTTWHDVNRAAEALVEMFFKGD